MVFIFCVDQESKLINMEIWIKSFLKKYELERKLWKINQMSNISSVFK